MIFSQSLSDSNLTGKKRCLLFALQILFPVSHTFFVYASKALNKRSAVQNIQNNAIPYVAFCFSNGVIRDLSSSSYILQSWFSVFHICIKLGQFSFNCLILRGIFASTIIKNRGFRIDLEGFQLERPTLASRLSSLTFLSLLALPLAPSPATFVPFSPNLFPTIPPPSAYFLDL